MREYRPLQIIGIAIVVAALIVLRIPQSLHVAFFDAGFVFAQGEGGGDGAGGDGSGGNGDGGGNGGGACGGDSGGGIGGGLGGGSCGGSSSGNGDSGSDTGGPGGDPIDPTVTRVVDPLPSCEQLGNCPVVVVDPPPSCQQLGTCPVVVVDPPPSCEQLGNCPVVVVNPPPPPIDPCGVPGSCPPPLPPQDPCSVSGSCPRLFDFVIVPDTEPTVSVDPQNPWISTTGTGPVADTGSAGGGVGGQNTETSGVTGGQTQASYYSEASYCSALQGQVCNSGVNSCGMNGTSRYDCGGSCNAQVPADESCPAPQISFSPNGPLIQMGSTCTLSWSASNVTRCSLSGSNGTSRTVVTNGTFEVTNLRQTNQYTLTCYNGRVVSASKTAICRVVPQVQEI